MPVADFFFPFLNIIICCRIRHAPYSPEKAGFQVIAAAAKKTGRCLKAHSVNYRRKGLPFPESQRIIRMLGCRKLVFAERI